MSEWYELVQGGEGKGGEGSIGVMGEHGRIELGE